MTKEVAKVNICKGFPCGIVVKTKVATLLIVISLMYTYIQYMHTTVVYFRRHDT